MASNELSSHKLVIKWWREKKRWSRKIKERIRENIKGRKWITEERRRENTNWLPLDWHNSSLIEQSMLVVLEINFAEITNKATHREKNQNVGLKSSFKILILKIPFMMGFLFGESGGFAS